MIGQNKIRQRFMSRTDELLPLIVLVGGVKTGKTTAAQFIATCARAQFVRCGNKVEEVREVIETAYKQIEPVIYYFKNIQEMNVSGVNALLKITEEPPFKAKFIISVDVREHCLPTILSRAEVIEMEPYTRKEIEQYAKEVKFDLEWAGEWIESPGMLWTANQFDYNGMINSVASFISAPTYSKFPGVTKNLKFKDDEEGWDLNLFIATLQREYQEQNKGKWSYAVLKKFSQTRQQMRFVGVNKKMLIDGLLMEIIQAEV